jgi:hypothetical protein
MCGGLNQPERHARIAATAIGEDVTLPGEDFVRHAVLIVRYTIDARSGHQFAGSEGPFFHLSAIRGRKNQKQEKQGLSNHKNDSSSNQWPELPNPACFCGLSSTKCEPHRVKTFSRDCKLQPDAASAICEPDQQG